MSCEQMLRARQAPIMYLMPITSAFGNTKQWLTVSVH